MNLKLILIGLSCLFFALAAFNVQASVRWEALGWGFFVATFAV